ncbi:MAG TPA: response regulator [Cyclobacteriaceae bacterium]|jgi:CheY-like chemotaxis protein|nr:response regulator [Cyclobacteriaceae bacterium]
MKNEKVLLVEDTIINQMVVNTCLSKQGIGVTIANHGKEALDLIQSKDFHLVLMDLHMPEMDGYESTLKIRSMNDYYFKTVPIILFSATLIIDAEEKEKAVAFGFTDFMNKPFTKNELNCIINKYIRNGKSDNRRLSINFDDYTDNDSEFKQELIKLMINDIKELQQSFAIATEKNDFENFRHTCDKIVGTISMLSDKEFTNLIEALKNQDKKEDSIIHFNKLSCDIIKSLTYENNAISHVEN